MAKALQGFELPPEIALSLLNSKAFYRAGQNQLRSRPSTSATPKPSGDIADDLFKVTEVVNGAEIAESVEQSGCRMTWPA